MRYAFAVSADGATFACEPVLRDADASATVVAPTTTATSRPVSNLRMNCPPSLECAQNATGPIAGCWPEAARRSIARGGAKLIGATGDLPDQRPAIGPEVPFIASTSITRLYELVQFPQSSGAGAGSWSPTWAAGVASTWASEAERGALTRIVTRSPARSCEGSITVGTLPCQSRKIVPSS